MLYINETNIFNYKENVSDWTKKKRIEKIKKKITKVLAKYPDISLSSLYIELNIKYDIKLIDFVAYLLNKKKFVLSLFGLVEFLKLTNIVLVQRGYDSNRFKTKYSTLFEFILTYKGYDFNTNDILENFKVIQHPNLMPDFNKNENFYKEKFFNLVKSLSSTPFKDFI